MRSRRASEGAYCTPACRKASLAPLATFKYFYLAAHEKLEHKGGGVIDFSKCFSVRKNSYDYLLQRKTLQMQPEIAKAMALKLALYFHRAQEPKAAAAA